MRLFVIIILFFYLLIYFFLISFCTASFSFNYITILTVLMRSTILVGGQAVIDGVMMRVPGAYSTAVRTTEGQIKLQYHDFQSIISASSFFSLPIVRGGIHLYESMKIGYQTLEWSVDVNMPITDKKNQLLELSLIHI